MPRKGLKAFTQLRTCTKTIFKEADCEQSRSSGYFTTKVLSLACASESRQAGHLLHTGVHCRLQSLQWGTEPNAGHAELHSHLHQHCCLQALRQTSLACPATY